jgi:methyl-accepting chemotaxis protein
MIDLDDSDRPSRGEGSETDSNVEQRLLRSDGGAMTADVADDSTAPEDEEAEETIGGRQSADSGLDISATALLDTLPQPALLLDASHRVIGWNRELEVLTGVDRERALGSDSAARLLDHDHDRTLADVVVDSPDRADQVVDAERSGRDQNAYEHRRELRNASGSELKVDCVATPIYQEGRLQGVIQLFQDNTSVVRKRNAMADLVTQVAETTDKLEDGYLSARVEYTDEHGVLDQEVLDLVDAVNAVAENTEEMVQGLAREVEELSVAADDIAGKAVGVDEQIAEQTDSIRQITDEMQEVSATMEEIASTSEEVAAAASQAQSAAKSGSESSDTAKAEMDAVVEVCDGLVETVTKLETRMEEVDDVVDVIADVAEETNLLALNANIEAARAGEEGSGFSVVANEVKSLADETRSNAEEISQRIAGIQEQTQETLDETKAANDRVRAAGEDIDAVIGSLDEIAEVVDEAATGITEVAEANDDQSASVEEVTATAGSVAEDADEIEARIEEVTALTEEQRDSIEDMVEHLSTLAADDDLDVATEETGLADR